MQSYHEPVLLAESLEALAIEPEGVYVDATFGGGGHAARLLERLRGKGRLYAFDQDDDARANTERPPFAGNPNFQFIASNFRHIKRQLRSEGVRPGTVQGVLADLGVSSYQLDTPERGFSYRFEAELDMRMNRLEGPSAADVLNERSAEELQQLFGTLGEVRNARTLAQTLVRLRAQRPFRTTGDLLAALEPLVMGERWRYLSQVFQALRMDVNDELGALAEFLAGAQEMLAPGGRLVVITYHSIEDRLVKNFIRTGRPDGELEKDFYGNITRPFDLVHKKPIEPTDEEISRNTRARSAKLRVAAKR